MTRPEFEKLYRQAVTALREEYQVGEVFSANGHRYCRIDGIAADDFAVIAIAFGEQEADRIFSELNESIQVFALPHGQAAG